MPAAPVGAYYVNTSTLQGVLRASNQMMLSARDAYTATSRAMEGYDRTLQARRAAEQAIVNKIDQLGQGPASTANLTLLRSLIKQLPAATAATKAAQSGLQCSRD